MRLRSKAERNDRGWGRNDRKKCWYSVQRSFGSGISWIITCISTSHSRTWEEGISEEPDALVAPGVERLMMRMIASS